MIKLTIGTLAGIGKNELVTNNTREKAVRAGDIKSIAGVTGPNGHLFTVVTMNDGEVIEPVLDSIDYILTFMNDG